MPYLDTNIKGTPNFDAQQMKTMVAEVKAAGLPVLIHCNGDYTIDIALDAIEAAYAASTAQGINRIEHSTMARPDQIVAHEEAQCAAELPDEPCAAVWRRLSR